MSILTTGDAIKELRAEFFNLYHGDDLYPVMVALLDVADESRKSSIGPSVFRALQNLTETVKASKGV